MAGFALSKIWVPIRLPRYILWLQRKAVQRKGIFQPCIPFISLHNSFINGYVTPPVPDIIVGTLHTTGSQT